MKSQPTFPSPALRRVSTLLADLALVAALFMMSACAMPAPARAESKLKQFVTVRGDQLYEGDKPFRFIAFNIPNLLLVEDNVAFTEPQPWRLPDRFEITDALSTVRELGGTVVRTYVISVLRTNDPPNEPKHVLAPGKFNEEAFRVLDLALQAANEQGVRLIIPLVDNWSWMGGRIEYAAWRGKGRDDFWTDPQIIADFKETIRFIVTRTNTLTGLRYCDDKAVLCWETGNEVTSPASWTREIAAYIKSLDSNHPVMDGFHTPELRPESLAMKDVDIVTTHHYPNPRRSGFDEYVRQNWAKAKGKKPYVVGEFGFVTTDRMEATMKAIRETGAAGGLLWSLRFRNRDGGFYWHSEPAGGNQYKAFHWPGSGMGDAYDEISLMSMVRRDAFEIRGLPVPPVPVPAPPKLLPIEDAAAISWQGSVAAASYTVERAPKATGPWSVAGVGIDESFVQYRPLFADESAPAGNWYYRVKAANTAGASEPSNVVGPVQVTHATFVDELADFSKTHARQGKLEIKARDCRKAKEDAHRAAGNTGDSLTYRLSSAIEGFRVFTFFPQEVADLTFSVSDDGEKFREIKAVRENYFQGVGDYGYWKPVLYRAENIGGAKFLKIGLTGETQIGRVEITRAADKNPGASFDGSY
jgi:mannan endo-1,4-beta-mannosidase